MTLSTHVLDTARGAPAQGVAIELYALDGERRTFVARAVTNRDGRTDAPLVPDITPGSYELVFAAGAYFAHLGTPSFYTDIAVRFTLADGAHYHVPLLLAPWGYSTYRGS